MTNSNANLGTKKFRYVVYRITFPNKKIYIGKDVGGDGHSIRYFGSWDQRAVEAEFTKEELMDFRIRREILFESDDKREVAIRELELIVSEQSNDPSIGYNRSPKFRG